MTQKIIQSNLNNNEHNEKINVINIIKIIQFALEPGRGRAFLPSGPHLTIHLSFLDPLRFTPAAYMSRGETHDPVLWSFINLMKLPNDGPLIFNKVPSNNFMFNVVLLMNGCLYDG